jgi:flagellar biosynthesis/type III secretory pathway protein FliH
MDSLDSVQLFDVIQALIQADTWAASQRIIEAHPELLSDEADRLLGQLVAAARQQDDAQAEGAFTEYRQLLARCRQMGVEAAFAEGAREGGEIPSELGALLAALPPQQRQILLDTLGLSDSEDL